MRLLQKLREMVTGKSAKSVYDQPGVGWQKRLPFDLSDRGHRVMIGATRDGMSVILPRQGLEVFCTKSALPEPGILDDETVSRLKAENPVRLHLRNDAGDGKQNNDGNLNERDI